MSEKTGEYVDNLSNNKEFFEKENYNFENIIPNDETLKTLHNSFPTIIENMKELQYPSMLPQDFEKTLELCQREIEKINNFHNSLPKILIEAEKVNNLYKSIPELLLEAEKSQSNLMIPPNMDKVIEEITSAMEYQNEFLDKISEYLYLGNIIDEVTVDDEINYKKMLENFVERKGTYYRGHAYEEWLLIPTLFRKINQKESEILKEDIYDLYKNESMHAEERFGISYKVNPYKFLALMQHSENRSMLLDITSDPFVAISFALSRDTFEDGSTIVLYKFDFDEVDIIEKETEADELLNKYTITTNYEEFCDSKFKVIDCKTNDRMTYQKGAFLLKEKGYLNSEDMEQEEIYKQIASKANITKYIIDKKYFIRLHNEIYFNKSEYKLENLMNPYNVFSL